MIKEKLKKYSVPAFYLSVLVVFGTSLYLAERLINNKQFKDNDKLEYVDSEIFDNDYYIPVIQQDTVIFRPYIDASVVVFKKFYDIEMDDKDQENALIFYENTYIQNSGIDYQKEETFDVVSVLEGTVVEVSDNKLLGKTVKIKHSNDLISIYQSLSEASVKENDTVIQGQIIGKSGTSEVYGEKSNLHFELTHNGLCVNPDKYYDKNINELN